MKIHLANAYIISYAIVTEELLGVLKENPFQSPPPDEKLAGDLRDDAFIKIPISFVLFIKLWKKSVS